MGDNAEKRKGRGSPKGPPIELGKKLEVEWNEFMRPVGPNRSLFMSYLDKMARNGIRLPLTYVSFPNVHKDLLDYIWREVQDNTNAPHAYENNCLQSLSEKWRSWKNRVKTNYFTGKTKEECQAMVPKDVEADQWKVLIEYCSRDDVMQESERNKKNRQLCGPIHRTGRNSCANIRRENDPISVAARTDEKTLVTAWWIDHSFDVRMLVDSTSVMYWPPGQEIWMGFQVPNL